MSLVQRVDYACTEITMMLWSQGLELDCLAYLDAFNGRLFLVDHNRVNVPAKDHRYSSLIFPLRWFAQIDDTATDACGHPNVSVRNSKSSLVYSCLGTSAAGWIVSPSVSDLSPTVSCQHQLARASDRPP